MDRPKILIADDEAHILHVVQIKLQNGGFEVVSAMDGQEALDLAGQVQPALLISDLQMPLLSGLELAAALYRNLATRHIPIILLTARGFEIDQQMIDSTSIRMVMTKPFGPRDLLSRVQQVLGVVPAGAL